MKKEWFALLLSGLAICAMLSGGLGIISKHEATVSYIVLACLAALLVFWKKKNSLHRMATSNPKPALTRGKNKANEQDMMKFV